MDIIPLGHASFKIKGKSAIIVTDPYKPEFTGLKFPKHIEADIITVSHNHEDHNYSQIVDSLPGKNKIVFSGPGEYEASGVEITGISTYHDNKNGAERGTNTIYKIEVDGLSIVHLGDLGHKLSETEEETLGDIDILLIPVGGSYTLDIDKAADLVTQLEPKIVIPMHYWRQGLKSGFTLASVNQFLKEMGKENITPQPKLNITKDKLPEETEVIILE